MDKPLDKSQSPEHTPDKPKDENQSFQHIVDKQSKDKSQSVKHKLDEESQQTSVNITTPDITGRKRTIALILLSIIIFLVTAMFAVLAPFFPTLVNLFNSKLFLRITYQSFC